MNVSSSPSTPLNGIVTLSMDGARLAIATVTVVWAKPPSSSVTVIQTM